MSASRKAYTGEKTKGGIVMNFTSFQEGDKLTIALTGEIDHHCAKTYIRIIAAKIETVISFPSFLKYSDFRRGNSHTFDSESA